MKTDRNNSLTRTPTTPAGRVHSRETGKILVIGGYGNVGRAIAARLAPMHSGRVVIAGRSEGKAIGAAAKIGHRAQGRMVDIYSDDSAAILDDVALAVVCLDQKDTRFVERCLSRGILYIDISANHAFHSQVERLDTVAKYANTTALLSVGVSPGLTNLLAARACERMQRVERIDILLELGLGDHHGRAAVEWMFDNLGAEYDVEKDGRAVSVRSFGESLDLRLPGAAAGRAAYRFNFSDQHVLSQTLGVPAVSTWVRFEDRLSTWALAKLSQYGIGRVLRRPWWRRLAVWLFMNIHLWSDICGVAVRAKGLTRDGHRSLTVGVVGRGEALMTAIVAVESVHQMLTRELSPGVLHIEQTISLDLIIEALEREMRAISVSM